MKLSKGFLLLLGLAVQTPCFAAEVKTETATNALQDGVGGPRPSVSEEGYIVKFLAEVTSLWGENQGGQTKTCEAFWTSGSCAIRQDVTYDHHPVYDKQADRKDYDLEGNLIQWRPSRIEAVFDTRRNDVRMESSGYTITPDGRVTKTNLLVQIFHYKIGDRSSISLLDQFRLATGNGFDRYVHIPRRPQLGMLEPEKLDGNFGESLRGVWTIKREGKPGVSMIREAVFMPQGSTSPLVVVANSGLVERGGLALAASGSFVAGPYKAQFQVLDFRNLDSAPLLEDKLFRDITNYIGSSLPENVSEIVDFRREKVERTVVTNSNGRVIK